MGGGKRLQPRQWLGVCLEVAHTVSRSWKSAVLNGVRTAPTVDKGTLPGEVSMATIAVSPSVESTHRASLPELMWEDIREAGAYVEKGSGDLYRIPKEALIQGSSPIVVKESRGSSILVQLSRDPFCTTLEARLRAAQHNIQPNF